MLDARTRGSFIYFVRRVVTVNVEFKGCRFSIDSGSAKHMLFRNCNLKTAT